MLTFDLMDELVAELVMEEGVTVVREALRELVTDYMEMSVVEDIVDELVKGEMSDLVRATVLILQLLYHTRIYYLKC